MVILCSCLVSIKLRSTLNVNVASMRLRLGPLSVKGLLARLVAAVIGCSVSMAVPWHDASAQNSGAVKRTSVRDLRIGVHASKTRIVMDMDGPIRFNTFALADPYRVVLDLPGVDFTPESRALAKPTGGISGYRFGLFEPGTSRVVIDLVAPMVIAAAFELPPRANRGHRLVIDLQKVSRADFLIASAESVRRRIAGRRRAAPRKIVAPPDLAAAPSPGGGKVGGSKAGSGRAGGGKASSRKKVIVLDPGHGGVDPGAIGASGTYEKSVVLAAARTLKRVLEASGRYTVLLTRDRDLFLRLRQRVAVSRSAGADLFISVHADSIGDKSLRGASIYTLSENASDKEAAQLAEHENKADIIAGMDFSDETPEVTNILIDLAQRETMNQSARFAGMLAPELRSAVRTHRRAHRFAGFAVLKAPDVPSILLEIGYISNPDEERMLRSRAFQEKVAVAVRRGIDRYFHAVQSAAR